MPRTILLLIAASLISAARAPAQVISAEQLEYLRQEFIEAAANSIPGTFIVPGTLPPSALASRVPPSLLDEADPVSGATAAAAQATANNASAAASAASASAASASATASSAAAIAASAETAVTVLAAQVDDIDTRLGAVEAQVMVWDASAELADEWSNSTARATAFDAELDLPFPGFTVTLYIANGIITNITQEGP